MFLNSKKPLLYSLAGVYISFFIVTKIYAQGSKPMFCEETEVCEKLERAYGVPTHRVIPSGALIKGDVDGVTQAIANGADVNQVIGSGTPLSLAVGQKNKEMIRLLLTHGANPSLRDESSGDGDTPLHLACIEGEEEIAELLIASGADVDAKNNTGDTPLSSLISDKGGE